MSNSNDSLVIDTVESSDESGSTTSRRKAPLKVRLARAFTSGALKSPKSPGVLNRSPYFPDDISEVFNPSRKSPSTKSRYSWQSLTSSGNSSPTSSTAISSSSRTTTGSSGLNSPKSPLTPKSPQYISNSNWFVNDRMKYSPQQQQQQQKERKSESDVGSVEVTPSHAIRESSKSEAGTTSGGLSSRVVESAGLFAWMRVFRLASILHETGC